MYKDKHKYDDIINMPYQKSRTHPHMSLNDRAAQFAPFAALNGHSEAVKETERLVDQRITLDQDAIEILNKKIIIIKNYIKTKPQIIITYFIPDNKKNGGKYITETKFVKKIDEFNHKIIFNDYSSILIDDVYNIESELFKEM